ncbi:sigma-70 family RNA polymerase sigma factor [Brevibacillus formosus]|uniref:sigma-70 family RNA polymerase sigma factor n=1 Tax=Brevibacillus formosus TaxID=54913 RepID=UPI001CA58E57|nr:sigma-70 family RNA polymerase sigma factor [Brevibacillus formosus]MBW5467795.1 sigma-70 family RNA polymerase sigma factor [Brevibacillus formosus]
MKEENVKPWLIRMRQGEEDAFQEVYRATRTYAYNLIYFLAPYKQDVDDMMSEVYVELIRSIDRYDVEQPFIPWFNGLIVRQVRNWNRSIWRRFRLLERVKEKGYEAPVAGMEDKLRAISDELEVIPAVEKLSFKLKEIVVLRYYQNCSLEEIAVILQIPLGTVKSRHHLAMKKLKEHFEHRINREEASFHVH